MIMLGAVQLFEAAGFEALVAFSSDEAVAHLEGRSGIVVARCVATKQSRANTQTPWIAAPLRGSQ